MTSTRIPGLPVGNPGGAAAAGPLPGRRPPVLSAVALAVVLALVAGAAVAVQQVLARRTADPAATLPAAVLPPGDGVPPGAAGTVTVDPARAVGTVSPDLIGLSFEKSLLAQPVFDTTRGNLVPLLRTLSTQGHLRFGGDRMDDETWWQVPGQPTPSYATSVITPAAVDRLDAVARASGWGVEMGVNLKHLDVESVEAETAYDTAKLGPRLISMACGNEPELYEGYTYSAYRASWRSCADAIGGRAPMTGPNDALKIRSQFLDDEGSRLAFAGAHYYPITACKGVTPTVEGLLSPQTIAETGVRFEADVRISRVRGLPFRFDETNSVSCEGRYGVSDGYATALWGIDYALMAAQYGAVGLNLHGRLEVCTGNYAPLCAATPADLAANVFRANPLYYGLLTVERLGTGTMLATAVDLPGNVRSYALRAPDGTTRVVLVDKGEPGGPARTVAVRGVPAGPGATTMTLSAPSLKSPASEIRLQGAQVGRDGTYRAPPGTPLAAVGDAYPVVLPTGSAVVLTVPPGADAVPGQRIRGAASERCLSAGAPAAAGAPVTLADCTGAAAQSWEPSAGGSLRNPATGRCLGLAAGAPGDGTRVLAQPCDGRPTQVWMVRPDGGLLDVGGRRCLDAAKKGTASGTPLQVWTCSGAANQQWSVGGGT